MEKVELRVHETGACSLKVRPFAASPARDSLCHHLWLVICSSRAWEAVIWIMPDVFVNCVVSFDPVNRFFGLIL